jgi:F-type H+-transporting ATPase subunit delta
MRITKQARREAKQLFLSCLVGVGLEANRVRQVVSQVLAQKPRDYLSILSHFERLVKLALDQRTAWVETAMALTTEQQAALQDLLSRRYGPGLSFEFSTRPALIGGLRVRVGSDVFDGSLLARLAALRESFSKS